MVDITYRTLGPWGSGKGANLQPSEVDANFYSLATAIVDLINNPESPNGIDSIAVSGTQMTITLQDGTVLGPYTLPVLTFRWRGEFEPNVYAVLDVFTVSLGNTDVADPATVSYGIYMVQIAGTYSLFDQGEMVGGEPVYKQLFGSTDNSLATMGDVDVIDPLADGDVLRWNAGTSLWTNSALGSMAVQAASAVNISGGVFHNLANPLLPGDAVNKAYVDSLPAGMTIDPGLMMANTLAMVGPAIGTELSDYLDYVLGTTIRGTMMYRGGAGWIALPPGANGLFLQTHDAGADPTWAVGGSGVVSITAGTGINTGGAPITNTGTVSLATIADSNLLANISGVSAAPVPATLSALLDHSASNVRGSVLMRAGGGWVALAPGISGYFLKTQGTGADVMWDAPAGSGTVTSIAAGTGLTTGGAPITGSGTISFATTADSSLLANVSGSTAAPAATSLTLLLDHVLGTAQGSILYRSASAWVQLTPGTSGQILTTGGTGANPSWANAPASPAIGSHLILANITGASAVPIGNTLSNILDAVISSTRGTLIYRTSSGWTGLAPGTAGQVLTTGGSAADPAWAPGGSTISVGDTPPASPSPGAGWWDSADGQLYIRYDDGNSAQWVPASNQPGSPGPTGATGASGPAGPTGSTGPAGPIGTIVAGTGLSGGGSTSSVTVNLATPVSIANGGTSAATAPAALVALGAAPLASPVFTGTPSLPAGAIGITAAAGDNDTSIATTAFVQAAVTPTANNVGRNVLHNSMFNVAQRIGPFTTNNAYTLDRWVMGFGGGTLSVTQLALADADRTAIGDEAARNCLQSVCVAGGGVADLDFITQYIEDIRRLSGKTVTVSFWARATAGTPKLAIELNQSFGTGGSPSANVSTIGSQAFTLSTNWTRYVSTPIAVPSAVGKTFGTTAGTDATALTLWQSAGSTYAARASNIGTQSYTLQVWGIQLEIGSVATPLEKPDPQQDLAKCQRFYVGNGYFFLGAWNGAGSAFAGVASFPVQMRAAPTIVFTGAPSLVNCSVLNAFNPNPLNFVCNSVATAAAQTQILTSFTASADL
jgi:hypothetical protein